ncbi:MAG: DNA replication/repair protein RecF [Dokdonella sp.]
MYLSEIRLANLRCFETLDVELGDRWNYFLGGNGAGKTTLLEAVYLLSHARSFRGGSRTGLGRREIDEYSVFGRLEKRDGSSARLGLSRSEGRLGGRIDGAAVPLGGLLRQSAVVCFEPGSHDLIAGSAELRRSFLDWGVFHVEPEFLECWRRHQKALRQRNALLRRGGTAAEFEPWEAELGTAGQRINEWRIGYLARLRPHVLGQLEVFLPELGTADLRFKPGWQEGASLVEDLAANRQRDGERGHTLRGAHRADWSLLFAKASRREHLSRGQEKLAALACVIGQARLFAEIALEWPILCFDDLASELDEPHQGLVIDSLKAVPAQILITGTAAPLCLTEQKVPLIMFHVEHEKVSRMAE